MRDFAALAFCHLPDGLAVDGFDLLAVEFELDFCHSAASFGMNSSGKYLMTEVSGLEAAWPRPQIDASLVHKKAHRFQRCALHASRVGQSDYRARADETAVFFQGAEIERDVIHR